MTNYHVKEFGSAFVVGTDDEEILVCVDRKVATQVAIEAGLCDAGNGNSVASRFTGQMEASIRF
jgi:hypothetical protein